VSNRIIVTGTSTEIGKTVFAAGLTRLLNGCYWKPVQAGDEDGTDRERVLALSGLPPERALPEAYRLAKPCSPHEAAAAERIVIDPVRLVPPTTDRVLVIEGAGGALVPLRDDLLFADQFARWVATTLLGTINHSLLTIEALRARGVPVLGVAFTGDANEESEATIARIGGVKRLGRLPRLDPLNAATLAQAMRTAFDPADFA